MYICTHASSEMVVRANFAFTCVCVCINQRLRVSHSVVYPIPIQSKHRTITTKMDVFDDTLGLKNIPRSPQYNNNNTEHPNNCVLCFCGLPGSGKTTVSLELQKLCNLHGIPNARIRFDEYEKKEYEKLDTGENTTQLKGMKKKFEPESWKRARDACFRAVRDALDDADDGNEGGASGALVILDDTMHYKSMRREAYRYAREFRAAFIVVHVDVSEEECWMRNSRRDDGDVLKVPREAFERLAAAFDRPGKGGYDADEAFDKNYMVVKPPKKGSGGGSGSSNNTSSSNIEEEEKEYAAFCQSLLDEIYARWLTDETPRRKDELDLLKLKRERSATDRVITAANTVHDVDVQTRKLTTEFMKKISLSSSSKSGAAAPSSKVLAERVRRARLDALNLCREETKFDARKDQHVVKEENNNDDDDAEKYIGLFREMLKNIESSAAEKSFA